MRKSGDERITFRDEPVGYSVRDFWSWNCSDLLNNTLRGEYAEFIVATALKLNISNQRVNWEPWDLTYPLAWADAAGERQNVRIEVKSSAYCQSWQQRRLSKISFGIRPTRLQGEDGRYSEEMRRQSDVYVFCLFAEKDSGKADPLRLERWEFYVLPTGKLDESCGKQKTISLASLLRLNPLKVDYNGVETAVLQSIHVSQP